MTVHRSGSPFTAARATEASRDLALPRLGLFLPKKKGFLSFELNPFECVSDVLDVPAQFEFLMLTDESANQKSVRHRERAHSEEFFCRDRDFHSIDFKKKRGVYKPLNASHYTPHLPKVKTRKEKRCSKNTWNTFDITR